LGKRTESSNLLLYRSKFVQRYQGFQHMRIYQPSIT